MFKQLVENKIIGYKGQYFCSLCMCKKSSSEDAIHHTQDRIHLLLKYHETLDIQNFIRKAYSELSHNVAIVMVFTFTCIACQKAMSNLCDALEHIQSEAHIRKLENFIISNNQIKNARNCSMNLKVQANKSNTYHIKLLIDDLDAHKQEDCYINEKQYVLFKVFKNLYNYSIKDYETLINNGIIINEYCQLMCIFCDRSFVDLSSIWQHMKAKNHKIIEKECQVEGEIVDTLSWMIKKTCEGQNADNNLMCELSKCFLPFKDHIMPHIKGKQHTSLKNQIMNEKMSKNITFNVDAKINNEKKETNSIKTQTQCLETTMIVIPNMPKINKVSLDLTEGNYKEQLLNNRVTIHGNDNFTCKVCKRDISTLHNILLHIQGRSHKAMLKSQSTNSDNSEDYRNTSEIIDIDCSNDSITDLDISKEFSLSSNEMYTSDYNTSTYSADSMHETISLIDDLSEDKNEEILDMDKNEIATLNSFYFCTLCDVQVDINNLFEHLNTITHKCNISSMNMGDDIILYKCFCCAAIMQGTNSLITHLFSTIHFSNLINRLKYLETGNIEMLAQTFSSIQNKNFPLCAVFLPKVQNAYTQFSEECLVSFDVSGVKCLDNIKNSITYYCLCCRVVLNTHHNLLAHCQAKMHLWKVKQLFVTRNQIDTDNVTAITRQISKISISKENANSNKLDDDSVITNDVNAQITKHLKTSPFGKKMQDCKTKVKSLLERLNKPYSKKYLEIEEKMYSVQQKLDSIKLHLRPVILHDIKHFYCLTCSEKVPKGLDFLYEHTCLQLHKTNLEKITKNKKSNKLLSNYMTNASKDIIKCHPCGTSMSNDGNLIVKHMESIMHKKRHKMFVKIMDDIFDSVSQHVNDLWYSIQWYCCVLCSIKFKYKLEFIDHIIKKHSQTLESCLFNFCIPCTILWLDRTDSYTAHCNDIVHKYLIKNQDFAIEDFPESMKNILNQTDEISDVLFQQSQNLLNDDIQQEVIRSLENILKSHFPTVRVFIFGSRVTGLGFANSDIDIYIDCENTYSQDKAEYLRKEHFTNIQRILYDHKEEWEVKEIIEETRIPIIKLIYKRTGLNCDISAINGLSVENSKLIRSFNDAYPPCRKLILFIKRWFSHFNLPKRHGLTNYALAWLVIFYLQSLSYLPSVATLIKQNNYSRLICGWETGVAQLKKVNIPEQSISTLLVGFFEYYATFNYQYHVICPLMGRPITKQAFAEMTLPEEEMKPYIRHLKISKMPEYFRTDSPLCVQDPLELSHNLTKAVTSITLKCFKQYCQNSLSMLHPSKK